ncbi:MAG: hypothetical protein OXF79_14705 [Chloroflexi bacterium]|nr:hypothetical protein [Chloroflexota bacterium]
MRTGLKELVENLRYIPGFGLRYVPPVTVAVAASALAGSVVASAPSPSRCVSTCGEVFDRCFSQCEQMYSPSVKPCIEIGCPMIYRTCIRECIKEWDWRFE